MPIDEVVLEQNGDTWCLRREARRYQPAAYTRNDAKIDALVRWARERGFEPPWESDQS